MPSWVSQAGVFASVAAAALAAYGAYIGLASFSDIRLTATTVVGLSGTLAGFLLTALSVLVSVADRAFIENLRMTGHYRRLVHKLFVAAGLWLLVAAVGVAGHVVNGEPQRIIVAVAVGGVALALINFIAVGQKFFKVISLLSGP